MRTPGRRGAGGDEALIEPFQVTPLEFEGKEEVLDDLLRRLRQDADSKSDRWLREGCRVAANDHLCAAACRGLARRLG